MSVQVIVAINGESVHFITVTNLGPPGGHGYADDDGPGGPGVREYRWEAALHGTTVHDYVMHCRDQGAAVLAEKVLRSFNTSVREIDDLVRKAGQ